ncbi:helix-turn-helix transcriptional regulator [Streptomyces sp. NPDC048445]|uniref:helix-turn-helix transcriptional regulator n=1 Tax=Streptomyces sp. NPDC048445 TaxID=3365553 RepID=UPI00371E509C
MGQDVTSVTPSTAVGRFLTTEEVAARYRTSPTTISWWRRTKYGPKGIKVGRRVLYPQTEIERFERSLAEEQTEASA